MLLAAHGVNDRRPEGRGKTHHFVVRACAAAAAQEGDSTGAVQEVGETCHRLQRVGVMVGRARTRPDTGATAVADAA